MAARFNNAGIAKELLQRGANLDAITKVPTETTLSFSFSNYDYDFIMLCRMAGLRCTTRRRTMLWRWPKF